MKRLVILGGGESGVGTALLAKAKGYEVFVSDNNVLSCTSSDMNTIKSNIQNKMNY